MVTVVKQEQRVRVFHNGRSRAVRIPKEFDFEGDEVTIRREADGTLSIVPDRQQMTPAEFALWLRAQSFIGEDEDFPAIERLPSRSVDLSNEP